MKKIVALIFLCTLSACNSDNSGSLSQPDPSASPTPPNFSLFEGDYQFAQKKCADTSQNLSSSNFTTGSYIEIQFAPNGVITYSKNDGPSGCKLTNQFTYSLDSKTTTFYFLSCGVSDACGVNQQYSCDFNNQNAVNDTVFSYTFDGTNLDLTDNTGCTTNYIRKPIAPILVF